MFTNAAKSESIEGKQDARYQLLTRVVNGAKEDFLRQTREILSKAKADYKGNLAAVVALRDVEYVIEMMITAHDRSKEYREMARESLSDGANRKSSEP